MIFPLVCPFQEHFWIRNQQKQLEVVEKWTVRCPGKESDLSFDCLPQSHVIWILPTPRLTWKSCSVPTLQRSATTWSPCTWDMALKFGSVRRVSWRHDWLHQKYGNEQTNTGMDFRKQYTRLYHTSNSCWQARRQLHNELTQSNMRVCLELQSCQIYFLFIFEFYHH